MDIETIKFIDTLVGLLANGLGVCAMLTPYRMLKRSTVNVGDVLSVTGSLAFSCLFLHTANRIFAEAGGHWATLGMMNSDFVADMLGRAFFETAFVVGVTIMGILWILPDVVKLLDRK